MKLQYRFVNRNELNYPWYYAFGIRYQYDCQFHVVKVDYEVTCSNKLTYKGTRYILSESSRIEINHQDRPRGVRMARQEYDFTEISPDRYNEYIKPDGTITRDVRHGEWSHYTIAKLDTNSILESWVHQKVSIPDYEFMGTPGKLSRPVLLIHGLDSDYEVWGVKSTVNKKEGLRKNEPDFKSGKVKSYDRGSLPDILAQSNNLDNKDGINSNGIYFFQSPGKDSSGVWVDANPLWRRGDENNSQSYALYERIIEVMDDFYKDKQDIDWTLSDRHKIDLVGHSQGGLVIREMLRGLRRDSGYFLQGNENVANHINRVITVNTPHFGSALATRPENLGWIEQHLSGVVPLIEDLDNPNPVDRTLVKAEVNVSFREKYREINSKIPAEKVMVGEAFLGTIVGCIIAPPVGCLVGLGVGIILGIWTTPTVSAVGALLTDIILEIKGPHYIGVYRAEAYTNWNTSVNTGVDSITTLKEYAEKFKNVRKAGQHLDKNSDFMRNLNYNNIDGLFPLRPDGSKIILLPMYSDSTDKILPELFEAIGEEADYLCAKGNKDPNCFDIGTVFKSYVYELTNEKYSLSKPDFDKGLLDVLLGIQDNWLAHGDVIVEASSQKFISSNNQPDNINFLEPRNYAIHNVLTPWEPVLHGPFGKYKGAPQQGLDLLCALSPACDNAFAQARKDGRSAILKLSEIAFRNGLNENSLDVSNDFNLAPIYVSEGIQAFSISANGETILTAQYEPGIGSSITLRHGGTEQTELLLGPEFATQPSMSREGDSVFVNFTNYSGKSFEKSYFLPELPHNVTVTVASLAGSSMSPVIVGSAMATNPETQKPNVPPPGHRLAPVTLAVLHREARGEHEANTSRPRFLVLNATKDTLEFSKVAYYFTADPARVPKVVVDYPHVPVSVEHLGGDQWRFVLDVGNQKIAPESFYPSADGWQIRVHYSDWFEYRHLDDWSADYSLGFIQFNRKIVVYDKNGKIIWGKEPAEFESEDNGVIATPKGTLAWMDDAPWEANAFKPRVTVKNTGSVALSDYRAQLWFRVPQGKSLSSLNIWYAPESSPSVRNVGGRVWMLDVFFNKHILYPGDSVSEGNIGLNLTDWSLFDKIVCGIALKDRDGNILFGREPSVAECESYDGPGLLLPLFSMR
jgi:pimeloyl-ACP methyl ester carboxylesterase